MEYTLALIVASFRSSSLFAFPFGLPTKVLNHRFLNRYSEVSVQRSMAGVPDGGHDDGGSIERAISQYLNCSEKNLIARRNAAF